MSLRLNHLLVLTPLLLALVMPIAPLPATAGDPDEIVEEWGPYGTAGWQTTLVPLPPVNGGTGGPGGDGDPDEIIEHRLELLRSFRLFIKFVKYGWVGIR